MRLSAAVGMFVLLGSSANMAQDSTQLTGKFSGSYESGRGNNTRVVLDITSAADGTVKGTLTRNASTRRGNPCDGEYPVEGTFSEKKLDVRATEKAGRAECSVKFTGAVHGNKIEGQLGSNSVTLTK